MGIWIILAVMTGAAVLLLLVPLSRRQLATGQEPDDVAFYKAQIAEIGRDIRAGLIGAGEAEAARAEAARRLLRASHGTAGAAGSNAARIKWASILALVSVPAIALPLYLGTGAPSMPGKPLAERRSADPAKVDIVEAVARIEAHLAKNPDDGRGYEVVAPVYFRMERYADAARAWSNAIRLNGENPARVSSLAEALVAQANGIVSPEAKAAFQRTLALDSSHVKARYYLALAREQDGDRAGALADFETMLKSAPAEAAWAEVVRERIAALQGKPAMPQGGEALAAMPPQEREAAIKAMVESLETRLMQDGGTVEEWGRLIRSLAVLGDRPRALKALGAAREKMQANTSALSALEGIAKELGLQS